VKGGRKLEGRSETGEPGSGRRQTSCSSCLCGAKKKNYHRDSKNTKKIYHKGVKIAKKQNQ